MSAGIIVPMTRLCKLGLPTNSTDQLVLTRNVSWLKIRSKDRLQLVET